MIISGTIIKCPSHPALVGAACNGHLNDVHPLVDEGANLNMGNDVSAHFKIN